MRGPRGGSGLTKCSNRDKRCTYVHNEEVQPTPSVGEVFDETIRDPFQQHLQDEDVRENPVRVLQNDPDGFPLLNVHILKGLWKKRDTNRQVTRKGSITPR